MIDLHPCTKTRYESRAAARENLVAIQRDAREALAHAARSGGKVPKRVYRCDACGGWHLTSKDKP